MKTVRAFSALFLAVCLLFSLTACGGSTSSGERIAYVSSDDEPIVHPAGLLTAAAWNDNLHFEDWKALFVLGENKWDSGKFSGLYQSNRWGFDSTEQVKVTVKHGEEPVCGATVVCVDEAGVRRFAAVTGADGVAYLYPGVDEGTLIVESGAFSATAAFETATCDVTVRLGGAAYVAACYCEAPASAPTPEDEDLALKLSRSLKEMGLVLWDYFVAHGDRLYRMSDYHKKLFPVKRR